jgi:hypothetical protein
MRNRLLSDAGPPDLAEFAGVVAIIAFALAVSLAFPAGFEGWDDFHYLAGAERFLSHVHYVPADHWGARVPYVVLIAAAIRAMGENQVALTALNSSLFVVALMSLWALARLATGGVPAIMAILAAVSTPLFFRIPTTYYVECVEITSSTLSVLLAFLALWNYPAGRTHTLLLLASGLVGGVTMLTRETAVAFAAALAMLLLIHNRKSPLVAMRDIAILAAGHAVPVAGEVGYYWAVTGNPFYRMMVDERSLLIPSSHLQGKTFTEGSPLFNWTLESRWDAPQLVRLHWTVNPILHVLVSSTLALLPALAIFGGVRAWRRGGRPPTIAGFCGGLFAIQYVPNTYVLAIAPEPRYYAAGIFLAAIPAGLLLESLPLTLRSGTAAATIALLIGAVFLQPAPAAATAGIMSLAREAGGAHLSGALDKTSYLRRKLDPGLAALIRPGLAPLGGLMIADRRDWDAELSAQRCQDGSSRWGVKAEEQPRILSWAILKGLHIARFIPSHVVYYLRQEDADTLLLLRRC